jgi:hypothetical protein
MTMGKKEEIKLIAYQIWEEQGCQHGHDIEHWLKAELVWQERQKAVKPEQAASEPDANLASAGPSRNNPPTKKPKSTLKKS